MTKYLWILLCASIAQATTYHVSADSTVSGIAAVNALDLAAGDSVLFKRGETFVGQVVVENDSVVYGAFGSGAKPIIYGSESLTGWVSRGSFYAAKASGDVLNVTVGGVQYWRARWPNSGYATVTTTNGSTTVTSTSLTQGTGYWNGATFRHKDAIHKAMTATVSSWNGTTLTLSDATDGITAAYGFYLDNLLTEVDTIGEWFVNTSTDSVYVYTPSAASGLSIRGTLYDYGIKDSAKIGVVIRDLDFRGQAVAGVYVFSAGETAITRVKVIGNSVSNQLHTGIYLRANTQYCVVDSNTVTDCMGNGIYLGRPTTYYTYTPGGPDKDSVRYNTISKIGLRPGYGVPIAGSDDENQTCLGIGTHIFATGSNVFSYNTVDSTGYTGMWINGVYNTVSHNVVTNTVLKFCDGGGLYSYSEDSTTVDYVGAQHTLWQYNIVDNVVGSNEGTNYTSADANYNTNGIYFDHGSWHMRAQYNTISKVGGSGIFVNVGAHHDTLYHNTIYDCATATSTGGQQSGGISQQIETTPTIASDFIGNTIYSLNTSTSLPLYIQKGVALNSVLTGIGTIDSNAYWNRSGTNVVDILYLDGTYKRSSYTLSGWKTFSSQDAGATSGASTQDTLFVNRTSAVENISLGTNAYLTLAGASVTGTLTLQPHTSQILLKNGTILSKRLLVRYK